MQMSPLYRCIQMGGDNQTFLARKHNRYSHPLPPPPLSPLLLFPPKNRLLHSAFHPARRPPAPFVSLLKTSNLLFIQGNSPVILALTLDTNVPFFLSLTHTAAPPPLSPLTPAIPRIPSYHSLRWGDSEGGGKGNVGGAGYKSEHGYKR